MTDRIIPRVTKSLVLLALAASIAGLPETASAVAGASDTGRGERPQIRVVTTHELLRMDPGWVQYFGYGTDFEVEGVMGRFDSHTFLRAIAFMPDQTRRLIERMERARNDEERKAIVDGLLKAAKRRLEAKKQAVLKQKKVLKDAGLLDHSPLMLAPASIREDKRAVTYTELDNAAFAEKVFIEMLESMRYRLSDANKGLFKR